MDSSAVFEQLNELGQMPSPSVVALEIMRLSRDESTSLAEISAVVETDPALSAKLLKYANSVLISPGARIASVSRATVKLGLKTVMSLALGFSLLSRNRQGICKQFDYQTFWAHSLAKAIAARALAEINGKIDPDDIFTCGLLSHIGSLAFASLYPEEYGTLYSEPVSRQELLEEERSRFGIDHRELSGELFLSWGLPEELAVAVAHCSKKSFNDSRLEICNIMELADLIAEICMFEMPLNEKIASAEEQAQYFSLNEAGLADIFDKIVENWQRWGHIFQVPIPNCPLFKQIKETDQPLDLEQAHSEEPISVLVVDDDPMTLLSLKHLLKKSGKTAYTAEDGGSALEIAIKNQPDMVITDWKMPEISGIELCRMLRNTSITKHIYIIMLTGRETDDEQVQALDAGADDFVIKPFVPRVLDAKISSGERIIRFQQMINRDREVIQKYAARLASANKKLQTMAMTDVLTNLPNRRSAMKQLKQSVAEAQRHSEPLSCIMLDVDHFKSVNDRYGHDSGDHVLKELSAALKKTLRSYDVISRMGGEEFLIICDRSTLQDTKQLAERLRYAVENLEIVLEDGQSVRITVSLGIAAWNEHMESGEDMTRIADNALYRAKEAGRNKVMAAEEGE